MINCQSNIIIENMIYSDEDKKLVDQYKQTNILLRKQLDNLNSEIDRLLEKHANKVGLQKLPDVEKKITDPKVIQHEAENLRKRLQLLQRDCQKLKAKASQNFHSLVKECENQIQQQQNQKQQLQRIIKEYERKDKIADVVAAKEDKTKKCQKRISQLQEQLARAQKVQKDLMKQINYQAVAEAKLTEHMKEASNKHHETVAKVGHRKKSIDNIGQTSRVLKDPNCPSEQQWKQLKIQFLTFKEAKQNEENLLNMENQNLRNQMRDWTRKIKEKMNRIQVIKANEQKVKKRVRNYSTIEQPPTQQKEVRYRDRNNSLRYNNTRL